MKIKPKYKLGQKVIIVDKGYVDQWFENYITDNENN